MFWKAQIVYFLDTKKYSQRITLQKTAPGFASVPPSGMVLKSPSSYIFRAVTLRDRTSSFRGMINHRTRSTDLLYTANLEGTGPTF